MADRAAIRDYARQLTLVETDDFDSTKIDNIINQGVYEVATRFRWPFLETSSDITVVTSTQSYTLPTNFQHLHSLLRDGSRIRLREVSPTDAWNAYGDDFPSGEATSFFLYGGVLYLTKIPTAGETLHLFYYKTPATLDNDTDTPEWDTQFHMVLADYTISKIWEREEDFIKASKAMEAFDQGVEKMARWYSDQANDRPMIFGESPTTGQRVNNLPWLDDASLL